MTHRCGGAACGPLARVSPCVSGSTGDVLDYRCDFNATFTVGQTLVLGGVRVGEEETVASALRDILRVNAFMRAKAMISRLL